MVNEDKKINALIERFLENGFYTSNAYIIVKFKEKISETA